MTKSWIESKTLWFNIITLVLMVAGEIDHFVSSGEAISVMAVVNIVLRIITRSALSAKI